MDIERQCGWLARRGGVCALRIGCATLPLLLAACATRQSPRADDATTHEFAAKGYASVEHGVVTTTLHTWSVSGQSVRIVVAEPERAGASPLVIYLPGLGESSDAGERWRTTWSSAGYAVMSVQPLDDDAKAWASDLARAGEFKALGRQHYAGSVMSRRVQMLADVIGEAQRRAAAGEAAWRRIDWGKVAVAGFDLGAYTAMTVAGEHVREAGDAAGRVTIRAAIALSPYASHAAGSFDTRYVDIHGPVLSVTSDVDGDALGLVEGVELRGAPFSHMKGPDKYLLSLHGLPHSRLSGTASATGARAEAADARPSKGSAGKAGGTDSGQRRRGGKRQDPGQSDGSNRGQPGGGNGSTDADLSPTALQLRTVAAQDITTAFLDAYLKDDSHARAWLGADASRWLGTAGELRRK